MQGCLFLRMIYFSRRRYIHESIQSGSLKCIMCIILSHHENIYITPSSSETAVFCSKYFLQLYVLPIVYTSIMYPSTLQTSLDFDNALTEFCLSFDCFQFFLRCGAPFGLPKAPGPPPWLPSHPLKPPLSMVTRHKHIES